MVTEFRPTLENIHAVWEWIKNDENFDTAFTDDYPKAEPSLVSLLQEARFARIDNEEGWLVWATGIVPNRNAYLHVMSWKLSTRLAATAKEILKAQLFPAFNLPRVTALVPEWNRPARLFAVKVGMVKEGVIRNTFKKGGVLYSGHLFGMTREEAFK